MDAFVRAIGREPDARVVHDGRTVLFARYGPVVPRGGIENRGYVLEDDLLVPVGYHKTIPVGRQITGAFTELGNSTTTFMDGIRVEPAFRGRGFSRLFAYEMVRAFEQYGGTHLVGVTPQEHTMAGVYREQGYRELQPQRPFGTDLPTITTWLVREFGTKHI